MINLVRPGSPVCVPVKTVSGSELRDGGGPYVILGRVAVRVAYGNVADGVVSKGVPVYVVSQAQLDSGRFVLDQSVPVVRIADVDTNGLTQPVVGNQAQPVFVVSL